ncbi:unnamed protein product [Nezara viridula]|uniref:DUF229 domain containing protein n=1 Tax=Nezara viridula TaxID=85310 RepID=A0A9P0H2A7_NEZVI|nr:unnamed protein product [Nezara viridula]
MTFLKSKVYNRSHEQLMRKQLLLLGVVFLSLVWLLFQKDTSMPSLHIPPGRIIDEEFQGQTAFLINTTGCKIPYMDPFDELIQKFITDIDPPKCNKFNIGRLVKADYDSVFIDFDVLNNISVDQNQVKCYYTEFWRIEQPLLKDGHYAANVDAEVRFSSKDIEIKNRTTIVNEEFIKVFCEIKNETIYKDYFAFPQSRKGRHREHNTVSISLIGFDSVSRLNLLRQMPRTVAFLKEKVISVEMLGYNKVGDNTFPNMIPVLVGRTVEEIKETCWRQENIFDNCSFIWNKYKESNFSTAYYEDATWMGLFNYQKYGFRKQPTDFYGQIFSLTAENDLGCDKRLNAHLCIGNRMVLSVLLESASRYIIGSRDMLTWSMFWTSSLTHDYLNLPRLADLPFVDFMENLFNNDIFNSTIFIFMSDHGIRWGGIRSTYQGYMEERLPFLFISFPEWFRNTYQLAIRNLKANRRRLTTHFDLHETLLDLVDLNNLQDEVIIERTNFLYHNARRGISLFLPIPENRTCEDAGITENWCTCYTSKSVSVSNPMVKQAALALVNFMNSLLDNHRECSQLNLHEIVSARIEQLMSTEESNDSINTKSTDYIVTVNTEPGNGVFEATVRHRIFSEDYTVIGDVSRLNTYGDQSKCISHYMLKLYCFCI